MDLDWDDIAGRWAGSVLARGATLATMPVTSAGRRHGWAPRRPGAPFPVCMEGLVAREIARTAGDPGAFATNMICLAARDGVVPGAAIVHEMALARMTGDDALEGMRLPAALADETIAALTDAGAAILSEWGPAANAKRRPGAPGDGLMDPDEGIAWRLAHPLSPPLAWLRAKRWGRDVELYVRGEYERIGDQDRILEVADRAETTMFDAMVSNHVTWATAELHGYDLDRRGDHRRMVADMTAMGSFFNRRSIEAETAEEIRDWLAAGRQTFNFARDLHRELSLTDVDDVTVGELSMPYDSIYVSFEDIDGETGEGDPLDGFLVMVERDGDGDPETLYITPMSRRVPGMDAVGPLTARMQIDLAEGDLGIVEAIDQDADDIDHMVDIHLESASHEFDDEEDDPEMARNVRELALRTAESTRSLADRVRANRVEWAKLIANALLYIDHCGGGERAWPAEAPGELREKIARQGPGWRKAEQRLTAMGFTPLVRMDLPRGERGEGASVGDRSGPRAHWRRGHWRRQPCGPGLSLTRRVRVRPCMIGASKAEDGPRTYRLDGPSRPAGTRGGAEMRAPA